MSVVLTADLFKVGPPLSEVEQVGRAPSIDALSDRALAGATLRLFDQRREGKTSLALAVLARAHAANLATCNLPLDEYPTAQSAAARILAQFGGTLRAARRAEQIGGAAARIAGRIARTSGSEDLALLADLADIAQPSELTLSSVLAALRKRLQTSGNRAVLLIDEAHLIGDWAPDDQAAIRALLKDEHQRLGVLLASSEASAQSTLIPILQFLGEPFVIPHIAREDWQHDLSERFKRVNLSLDPPALERLRGAQLDRFLNLERQPPWAGRIPTRGLLTVIGHPGSSAEEAVQRIAQAEHGPSLPILLDARHHGDRAALVGALADRILHGLLGSEAIRRWRAGEPPPKDTLASLGSARSTQIARLLTEPESLQVISLSQLLALPPQGVTLAITWAHLLAERPMGKILWELRACVTNDDSNVALILNTFPATKDFLVGEQAALFGAGEKLEVTDPTTERWRELVRLRGLPVSDEDLIWLLLRTDGQARATAQILELTRFAAPDAKWAARRVWEQESERTLARVRDTVSFARAVTPHGAALMSAIAADEKPYRALRPYANAKQIARALGQLAYHGLIYSPRRGLWLLGDPLLRDALTNLHLPTETSP